MSESKAKIISQLEKLKFDVIAYCDDCITILGEIVEQNYTDGSVDYYWSRIPNDLKIEAEERIEEIVSIGQNISSILRKSVLIDEADLHEIPIVIKRMRATIHFRRFYYSEASAVHDDGFVLGFQPASQEEGDAIHPDSAKGMFESDVNCLLRILQLADEDASVSSTDISRHSATTQNYRPNTAFIMMWMNSNQPELEDVRDTVCSVFSSFSVRATRADDIEHEGIITQRILDEIRTSEFLFADLTGARPNVYYEVGFAHALGKRVILFRKKGTGLHFDLAGYNCPEYENLRELKEKLSRRLENITNKQGNSEHM